MQLLVAHWRAAESLHFHRWCGGGTTWSVTWDFSDPQMHRAGLPELRATVRTFSEELTNTGGRLPTSLGALTALERFDLSINAVTGQLPVEFSNCRRVVHVNLSCNRLSAFRVRLRLRRLWLAFTVGD
ncbi:GP46-like surface antigen, putative [Bodo saltans]|uniref:GP46-like surface antigen, putative n=1 Tax=Bodo saltans TaxID=75058 RepID=A0A0S4IJN8_BODSA|nr:GP46-like surface antigen, putative [Bodo saltans]|eukprot:CUE56775.1 GP46-like surface antigen, putative [Bodo saltans]